MCYSCFREYANKQLRVASEKIKVNIGNMKIIERLTLKKRIVNNVVKSLKCMLII